MAIAEAPAETPVTEQQIKLETRKFSTGENEAEFSIFRIEKASDWKPAIDYRMPLQIKLDHGRRLQMMATAISLSQWTEVEYKNPIPEETEADKANKDAFQKKLDSVTMNRRVLILELSTGKKIPGTTIEEKRQWLEQLGASELDAMYNQLLEHCSGMGIGDELATYMMFADRPENSKIVAADSFEDWMTASQTGTTFRFQRPSEYFICEIGLKQLSREAKDKIADAAKEPMPPGKPGKNPTTGIPDPNFMEYNWNDLRYLEALRSVQKMRMVMQLETVLPFPIPGSDLNEKFKWIGDRAMGDVIKLTRYIDNELNDYRRRLSFI